MIIERAPHPSSGGRSAAFRPRTMKPVTPIAQITVKNGRPTAAINTAAKESPIITSRVVNPGIKRHIALAMSPRGELTLVCRSAMKIVEELVRADSGMLATGSVELAQR